MISLKPEFFPGEKQRIDGRNSQSSKAPLKFAFIVNVDRQKCLRFGPSRGLFIRSIKIYHRSFSNLFITNNKNKNIVAFRYLHLKTSADTRRQNKNVLGEPDLVMKIAN